MANHRKKPKIHSVKFNVLMNMLLTTSQMLFPLITLPYVSRILSTFGTGAVAYVQSVVLYFSMVALLGIQNYGIKVCAMVRDDIVELSKVVKELLVILLVSTSIVFAVYLLSIFLIPTFSQQRTLFLIFSVGFWLSSFGVEWFYQAIEQYGYITVRNIVFKFIGLILMFLFVHQSSDYIVYGITVLVAGYGMNILNLLRLRKLVDFSIRQRLEYKEHLKAMFWYSIASISSGMYTQTDIVALGFLGNINMVGLYQLVAKIKNVLIKAVNSVGNVMLPRISYYKANGDKQAIINLMAKNVNFIGVVSGALIGGTVLCSDSVVQLMGGKDFSGSVVPLMLAVPAILFSSLNIALGNELIADSREREWAILNVIGFTCSVVYAITFIYFFGVAGAAISNSLTELTVLVLRCSRGKGFIRQILPQTDYHKIGIVSVVSVFIALLLKSQLAFTPGFISLIVNGCCFMRIYCIGLVLAHELFVAEMIHSIIKR